MEIEIFKKIVIRGREFRSACEKRFLSNPAQWQKLLVTAGLGPIKSALCREQTRTQDLCYLKKSDSFKDHVEGILNSSISIIALEIIGNTTS